ncbi:MAG: HAD family hydrolase [Candidatus Acidiferrales bacterium]
MPKTETKDDCSGSQTKIPIRAVVFDYGNVLSQPQTTADAERLAALCGTEFSRFSELYWRSRLAYDRADLTAGDYWAAILEAAGRTLSREQLRELIAIDGHSWARPNVAAIRWVEQLRKAGLRLAVLSNMPLEIRQYVISHCAWLSCFHHLTFSCDVGRVKPEAEIYQECLRSLDLPPEEILFLDDRPENVDAAMGLGIHGLVFDNTENTRARASARFRL